MQPQEISPPEALQDTIKCFWHTSVDVGELPGSFEVMPDGYAEIIFHFGSACSIATAAGWQLLPSPFLVGLLNQPALFRTQGRLQVIGMS